MKKETIEEAAENYSEYEEHKMDFIAGAKWQQEISYSEDEVYDIVEQAIKDNSSKQLHFFDGGYSNSIYTNLKKWFEQFKKK